MSVLKLHGKRGFHNRVCKDSSLWPHNFQWWNDQTNSDK